MPKPVFLMTVQEAHKEYSSLMDQIRAKYEQLDSGEFGAVDTPVFNAEACELANILTCVSQLCQKLNLPPPKAGSLVRVWRMQLCSHRHLRNTGLLSAPLVNLRMGDWLCVLPAITLVVDKSKKLNEATSSDW